MAQLKVEIKQAARPDVTVAALDGPLLIAHVPVFLRALQNARTRVVALDFSRCSYMDSAGLGAVLQLHKNLAAQGRRLVLAGLNQRVAALLKLTKADSVLEIAPDVAAC